MTSSSVSPGSSDRGGRTRIDIPGTIFKVQPAKLPFAALYPTIEDIWRPDRLAAEVLNDHRRIEKTGEH